MAGRQNNKEPRNASPNANRNSSLDDGKMRAAGRDSGSYPGDEALHDDVALHNEAGGVRDATGGTAGSPRGARGALHEKGPVGGASGNREGAGGNNPQLEGGGGGGAVASDLADVGQSTRPARKGGT